MQIALLQRTSDCGVGSELRIARSEAWLPAADTLRRASRFVMVGALGTLVDFSLFTFLSTQIGTTILLANTLAYCAGILNNYTLHRFWTYQDRPGKPPGRQFTQFLVVSLSALALNNLIVLLLAPLFSSLLANPAHGALAAKIFATGMGMGWNFLANHLWTFRAATGSW